MQIFTLNASPRTLGNKQSVKQIRRAGMVPAIVYGNGTENINFNVELKELKKLLASPKSFLINLKFEDREQLATVHDMQFHPLSDEPIHVDFLAVSDSKPVVIAVPVTITGNSEGVKLGGKLVVNVRKLKVSAMKENLPDELVVDITKLGLGKTINAGDLHYDNVQMVSPKGTIVCAVKATRASATAEATEEAK